MKNKTTEQLKSNLKMTKTITVALIVVGIALIVISTFGLITKEDNSTFIATFAVGLSCGGILPLQFINIKKIKTELESRESAN